jgi:hypothetical protein
MEPNVVLLPIDFHNSRKTAENIENQTYKTTTSLLTELSNIDDINIDEVLIYPITDFMDACNDQEINLELYFISYVYFE